ncbi:MAG: CBS domain-containing protein [Fidelibacterota bacterium]|nr:MAG: CBS domain-containing protein [Candidatus Neomarinimicrobiota bacterium]
MYTVKDILRSKGNDIWSIAPQATAYEALQIMSEKDVGALLVIDEGKLVGIFSERDYARKVILRSRYSKGILVSDIMTSEISSINPESTVKDCMALMTAEHIRHLPVMSNERLIGIVTIGDVVNQIISDQDQTIQQLERHIKKTTG